MTLQPLADRIRPRALDEVMGQEHLVGKNGILRKILASGRIPNMIFYGPPGTGKTTVANILAEASNKALYKLNATTASLSDIKDVIADGNGLLGTSGILLYLDEIQYFNRKQQQSLLEFMENGKITLIASTTENPYYYIYNALLSRASVFEFKPVNAVSTIPTLRRALDTLNEDFGTAKSASDEMLTELASKCCGDVRLSVNILENAFYISDKEIKRETVNSLFPEICGNFDRSGDVHYDLLSCLQKSIRGSDPNATLFYLAKILAGGDMISACRRLQVIASEDVGLAYPLAAVVTRSCVESAKELGLPEAAIPLANAAVLLATSPKSNSAYLGYHLAKEDYEKGLGQNIPECLKSPSFVGYQYPHNFPSHYVKQQYLPDDIKNKVYFEFGDNKTEQAAKNYFELIKKTLNTST